MASSNDDGCAEVYFRQGSCNIILKQGDLLQENDVDVIVIPTPENGQQVSHTYPLFEALWSKADQKLKDQITKFSAKIKPNEKPQIILDPKPSIILTPIPYFGHERKALEMLKTTYSACLSLAVKQNCQTIAFPTIGCGKSGFKSRDAADIVYNALAQFQQPRDKKMNEIRIIIYDKEIYNHFSDAFIEAGQKSNAKIKLIEISRKKSNPSEMSSRWEDKRASERQSQEETNYDDDRENDGTGNQRDRPQRQTSKLNPDSPEYQPKSKNQRRGLRRYHLSNNRTELHILQGDILETEVDAIVNAANEEMLGGSGVDGAIHRAAGPELQRACKAHKQIYPNVRLPTGRSRILLSYNMSSTTYYIINTAGPRYEDHPPEKCQEYLTSCYKTSLALANLYDLETIGFTAISCGIFGYPIDEGAEVALKAVDSNADSMKKIFFVLKNDEIYDAWVKKAEQLQFMSLDGTGAAATSTSKQPTSERGKATEKSNANNESNVSKQSLDLRVIDGSISDSTKKTVKPKREESSEKPLSDSNDLSDNPETEDNTEENRKSNKDEKLPPIKSQEKKSGGEEKKKTSNNPTEQERTQNKDQKPNSQPARKNKNA